MHVGRGGSRDCGRFGAPARSVGYLIVGLWIVGWLCSAAAQGMPAYPAPVVVEQPDGTPITLYLRGDEHAHWHEDANGYLVTKSAQTHWWVYARHIEGGITPTKHAVGKADPAALGLRKVHRRALAAALLQRGGRKAPEAGSTEPSAPPSSPPQRAPAAGTMRNLVVLVNFADLNIQFSTQQFDDLFNQVGYSFDGASGSVKDYYHEVSYNTLTVQSTIAGPVTLDNGYAYYGANTGPGGSDARPQEMVAEALAKLEQSGFDFSTMDGDGDGWVDGLTIIHAGGGEEYLGNDPNYIWSHQWQMLSTVTYDGVSMLRYHTEPARRGLDGNPATQGITRIGVICHENGHFLGLPDLYDYGYDSQGAGRFCLMAGGGWNGNMGTTPAHMSAWCKSTLGWVTPTPITAAGTYTLWQVETNAQIYTLQGPFPANEYFLIENRQDVGFDAALPGTQRGILIWHVDESQPNNDDQTHYKVDLEEASGVQDLELNQNSGDDADYFRAGNATAFTDTTTPNNLSYSGTPLGLNITNVGTTAATMSFDVTAAPGGGDEYEPDDLYYQANEILPGESQTHSIVPASDVDWVTFTLPAASQVVVETSGASGDTRMWLYDENLEQIEFDDDGGSGLFSRIERLCETDPLPAGTYYVKVDDYGNNDEIASYQITLTVNVCNDPPTVDAGPDRSAYEGQTVQLHADASDPNNDDLTYSWQQTGGPAAVLQGADTADVSFAAPFIDSPAAASLTFEVRVDDGHGGQASDSVNVRIYMTGDVDQDDSVDIFDMIAIVNAFGSQPGDANWNENADFNGDDQVDVVDVVVGVNNFGRSF